MADGVCEVYGALGSPYSLKMRAVMRYRRLPHTWSAVGLNPEVRSKVKAPVIPVIRFAPDDWRNDSTPMIEALEGLHAERRLIPDDAADAFLARLAGGPRRPASCGLSAALRSARISLCSAPSQTPAAGAMRRVYSSVGRAADS